MTDQDYLDIEARLATALGWANVAQLDRLLTPVLMGIPPELQRPTHPNHRDIYRQHQVPRWCRDNAAAFALMTQHRVYPRFMGNDIHGCPRVAASDDTMLYAIGYAREHDHDEEAAARVAIAQGVTVKLEQGRAAA